MCGCNLMPRCINSVDALQALPDNRSTHPHSSVLSSSVYHQCRRYHHSDTSGAVSVFRERLFPTKLSCFHKSVVLVFPSPSIRSSTATPSSRRWNVQLPRVKHEEEPRK
ncbi:hypothetical protein V6N13_131614 [Hibiscus sabdariffa]|uniref:Uncharacterized protein n=1 Tax=Hibiscus sabdariffa TaxID=183260 RepID=A0ABR2D8D6_9ROSI